jgi:hypothetical protein
LYTLPLLLKPKVTVGRMMINDFPFLSLSNQRLSTFSASNLLFP